MKLRNKLLIILLVVSSFSLYGNDPYNMQVPNYDNSINPKYLPLQRKIDQHNSRKNADPIGDKKYYIMSQQQGITPSQACMYAEVSCQSKLSKMSDCSADKGDGIIICNGKSYKRDDSVNETERSLIKSLEKIREVGKDLQKSQDEIDALQKSMSK